MWIIFAPLDRSRDTAHVQWPFQVVVMWSDWVTHNSGTDNRRKLKISKYVWRIKLFILQTPPRSKGRSHKVKWKLCTKHQIYAENVIGQWKYTRLIVNQCRRSEYRGPIFDRKFLNRRFCSCAVKYVWKSLNHLPYRQNFVTLIENRGRWRRWWRQFLDGSRIYVISAHVH